MKRYSELEPVQLQGLFNVDTPQKIMLNFPSACISTVSVSQLFQHVANRWPQDDCVYNCCMLELSILNLIIVLTSINAGIQGAD